MRTSSGTRARRTALIAVAGLATCATLITGCSSDSSSDSGKKGSTGTENITLHVGDFGSFGYDDKTGAALFSEYHQLHPNITIVEDNVADGQKYWDALKLHLSQGSGLADVQAIEVGFIAEATATLGDRFVDLGKATGVDTTKWLDWKEKQATTKSGQVIGLGTDVGPMAVCYRKDLFQKAGLPTDREAVAALWAGDWAKYIAVGQQFKAKAPAGVSFTDSASGVFNAVVSSQAQQYSDDQGKLIYDTSPGVKKAWDLAVESAQQGLSAKLRQFDDKGTWNAAFKNSTFATIACPSWMTGIIKEQAGPANTAKWDIAAAPESGNWGGAFLSVPKAGKHTAEATALAAWLTAPEQQAKVFAKNGNIPSTKAGLDSPTVTDATNPYFGTAPIGKVYTAIAKGVTPAPIGRYDGQVKTYITDNGLLDIEQHGTSKDKAWSTVQALVKDKIDQ
ncbi:carbohydrate ABC transporter substrate-binding protein [Streptomyces sp. SID13666]|uniref:ABC transporter substrate-binding protein n=1 Tax=unclassified Streptomyces TaxID=2593676 RepID=UPI0013BF75EE|nr:MULTISPECIES: ABC transporter substrate-binding protein [unclassified Streptomyces]NEA56314.1 carbohydrate ABC transporter substrate-binding protein [Streptomyces sp. SID13666]NEA73674.1 carbohydrate ABC transporter substrate-binding protein [Streptomyces sp. SID13588]